MSDLCHCVEPVVSKSESGEQFCSQCHLWYIEKEWKRDPRRLRAARDAMIEAQQVDDIVKTIIYGR